MKDYFNVKKNFGFGCMRLPMKGEQVDYAEFTKMVDTFLANGFNYFDTAHGYLNGQSEIALKECLTSRYPRESYVLADKLTGPYFSKNEDIRPFFESQLKTCGVEYFDFYLMHAQSKESFAKFKSCRAYETATELKNEGLIKHLGLSFHDKAEVLEQILTEYPQVEFVQIQFNYLDYEDPIVEGRKCYEVCRKFGKPIIVMEPVKGGRLVNLPKPAQQIYDGLQGGSYASYAIRFAAGFEGVMMVLSGMGSMAMMNDNIGYMKDFRPLNGEERAAVDQVCAILRSQDIIPCTACQYCIEHCPKEIAIADLFACMNAKTLSGQRPTDDAYDLLTKTGGKASACIKCGSCEAVCPQHLPIRRLLEDVARTFETH